MKNISLQLTSILFFCIFTFSSCSAIGGIFKAGMGVGIFVVVAVVALIAFIAMRVGKKNT